MHARDSTGRRSASAVSRLPRTRSRSSDRSRSMRDRYKYPHADRDAMPGEELTFYVTDRECGIRGDPGMCMLAQSAMRAFDTDQVWFGRRVAMVQVGAEVL